MVTMIRLARKEDLPEIMLIFEKAREFMRNSGNPDQWINGYPTEEIITEDIRNGNFYVEEINGVISGCFAFIVGPEPTYREINGEWLFPSPYGTIHRLASAGIIGGVADRCIKFCREIISNLRADTHEQNILMQNLLVRNGFRYCGEIRVANGSKRLAYQLPSLDSPSE